MRPKSPSGIETATKTGRLIQNIIERRYDKGVPVFAMKVYRGSEGIVPLILTLDTKRR